MSIKRILIIEDEELIGELCCSVLEEEGFITDHCTNITDAFEIIDTEKIDFILSDVRMPGGDGTLLKMSLNEKNILIPFLFMTAFSPGIDSELEKLDIVGVMRKPFTTEALLNHIYKHLPQVKKNK